MAHVKKLNKDFNEAAGIRLPVNSRLQMFPIMQESDGTRFLNFWRTFVISEEVKNDHFLYELHTVESEDWWENISDYYYGTPRLWWVLCLMNDVINPFEELNPGDQIKILKEDYLYVLLKDANNLSEL